MLKYLESVRNVTTNALRAQSLNQTARFVPILSERPYRLAAVLTGTTTIPLYPNARNVSPSVRRAQQEVPAPHASV